MLWILGIVLFLLLEFGFLNEWSRFYESKKGGPKEDSKHLDE